MQCYVMRNKGVRVLRRMLSPLFIVLTWMGQHHDYLYALWQWQRTRLGRIVTGEKTPISFRQLMNKEQRNVAHGFKPTEAQSDKWKFRKHGRARNDTAMSSLFGSLAQAERRSRWSRSSSVATASCEGRMMHLSSHKMKVSLYFQSRALQACF